MAWIESHTVLVRHRKTISTAAALAIKPVVLVGHLHVLWHSVLEQAEDGDLSKWDDNFIAASACWEGDPGFFCKALRGFGWITPDGMVHDWLDYSGLFLIKKYSTGNRKKLIQIWSKHRRKYGVSSKRAVSEQKASLPNQPNLTNQTIPNLTKRMGNFVPPTLEEVKNYCLERNNSINPQQWIDFYSSKGWMVGKNKMKDWKAAVRTWENNGYGRENRPNIGTDAQRDRRAQLESLGETVVM